MLLEVIRKRKHTDLADIQFKSGTYHIPGNELSAPGRGDGYKCQSPSTFSGWQDQVSFHDLQDKPELEEQNEGKAC